MRASQLLYYLLLHAGSDAYPGSSWPRRKNSTRPPPQSPILPKPVPATILPAIMRLGVNPEQLNRKQLLELVNQLIAQIEALLRRRQIINLLIWAGLSASLCLWPGPPPAQATASERSAAQSTQESIHWNPASRLNESSPAGNRISTRSR